MEGQAVSHKLEPKITWTDRPPMTLGEKFWGFAFYALLIVQLVLGVVMLASQNVKHVPADCASYPVAEGWSNGKRVSCCEDGWAPFVLFCVKQELMDEYLQCQKDNPGIERRLSENKRERNLWDALEEFPHIPTVLILLMVVLGGLWLHALRKYARPICWGTMGMTLVLLLYVAIRPMTAGGGLAWQPLVLVVLMVAILIWKRKAIDMAAVCISAASRGLEETPSVFAWTALVMLIYFVYLFVWAVIMIISATVWDVQLKEECVQDFTQGEDGQMTTEEVCGPTCVMGTSKLSTDSRVFLGILFSPTVYFIKNAMLIICATGIGSWYFHKDEAVRSDAAKIGFKWAWTISSGASFVCAVILYLVDEMKKLAKNKFQSPINFVVWLITMCIANCIQAWTRYLLIAHTFHGGGIRQTAKNSWDVLKRRLGDAVVNDTVAQMVLTWSTSIFCTAFGFIAWAWLDDSMEVGLLNTIGEAASDAGGFADILILLLIGVMFFFVSKPIFSLVFVAIFGSLIKMDMLVGFLGGIFIGSICCILFRYFSAVVLASSDVIFWCFALEADAGNRQEERFPEIYKMIDSQVVKGKPVEGDKAGAAQGVPAAGQMMSVQVPAGVTAGQAIQIQTASGPMNVTVPAGVSEGQTFQVQVPAAGQPAATV